MSEAAVVHHLLRAGYAVLRPMGDSLRYDLVLDQDDGFVRVQQKTGRVKRGCIVV